MRDLIEKAALVKANMLSHDKPAYVMNTMLGGIYIGFGMLLLVTLGGYMSAEPSLKLAQGVTFGVALTMVLLAGADLFTGNHFVMTIGALSKKTTWSQAIASWVGSYGGNLLGAILLAAVFYASGLATGDLGAYIDKVVHGKTAPTTVELFMRGVLCNVLVCIAVWGNYKLKTEIGRISVIFCCVTPFITMSFEHSIANMTAFSVAYFNGVLTLGEIVHNLVPVTLGNIVGGVFVALAYWVTVLKKDN